MIDIELHAPVKVLTEGDAGPYLLVSVEQLRDVETVLRDANISFSTAHGAIQLDGHDAVALIDFGSRADAQHIQQVLDAR